MGHTECWHKDIVYRESMPSVGIVVAGTPTDLVCSTPILSMFGIVLAMPSRWWDRNDVVIVAVCSELGRVPRARCARETWALRDASAMCTYVVGLARTAAARWAQRWFCETQRPRAGMMACEMCTLWLDILGTYKPVCALYVPIVSARFHHVARKLPPVAWKLVAVYAAAVEANACTVLALWQVMHSELRWR